MAISKPIGKMGFEIGPGTPVRAVRFEKITVSLPTDSGVFEINFDLSLTKLETADVTDLFKNGLGHILFKPKEE